MSTDLPPLNNEQKDVEMLADKPRIVSLPVKSNDWLSKFLFVIIMLMMLAGSLAFLNLKDDVRVLQARLLELENQQHNTIESMSSISNSTIALDNKLTNSSYSLHNDFSYLRAEMTLHGATLKKLSNITTNSVVLERLNETRNEVARELSGALNNMKGIVSQATTHIHDVQSNVSMQLSNMNYQLGLTVNELNSAVETAQATIHDEVENVRETIQNYVLATNDKFAAENDFVKYQLAGTYFCLRCCGRDN
jgi:hypothetical protein